jgi:uncharacterized protein VirK/YbjX
MKTAYRTSPQALADINNDAAPSYPLIDVNYRLFSPHLPFLKTMLSAALRSCLAGRRGSRRRTTEFFLLAMRALVHRQQSLRWLEFLHSTPALAELLRWQPRLLRKIYWPYLTDTLQCQERLDTLIAHYTFVSQREQSARLIPQQNTTAALGDFIGKSDARYEIGLAFAKALETEGELALQLSINGVRIYAAAFTFSQHNGKLAIAVGCLQGPSHKVDGLKLIQETTRDLHGLRPKNLMIRLLQKLGRNHGCEYLSLTGNNNRVVHYAISKGRVQADYDALWSELGATRQDNGDFLLSCAVAELNLEDIPSKKRSEAKKRAALLESALAVIAIYSYCH